MPSLNLSESVMAILNPNPLNFPSLWAVAYGEDTYGLWQAFEFNGVRQVMRWIEPGQFQMGSPNTEASRRKDEKQHTVTLTTGYWLADTACTQELWESVTGNNPSNNKQSPGHPVEQVSWDDCQSFIEQCDKLLGGSLSLRLPTEAEWEYACRGGTNTAYCWGDEFDNSRANDSPEGTVPVLQYAPNSKGLFQMHGNVYEWCEDWYFYYPDGAVVDPVGTKVGHIRVARGGYWFYEKCHLRSAYRGFRQDPDFGYDHTGLRLAGG